MRAISIQPDFFLAYYNLGRVFSIQQAFEKETIILDMALKINKNFPDLWLNIGLNRRRAKQNREAIEAFQIAATLQPSSALPFFNLSSIYYAMQDSGSTLEHIKRVLWIEPDNERYQDQFSYALRLNALAKGDLKKAMSAETRLGKIRFDLNNGLQLIDRKQDEAF